MLARFRKCSFSKLALIILMDIQKLVCKAITVTYIQKFYIIIYIYKFKEENMIFNY